MKRWEKLIVKPEIKMKWYEAAYLIIGFIMVLVGVGFMIYTLFK